MTYQFRHCTCKPVHARSSLQSESGWSGLAIDPPATGPAPGRRLASLQHGREVEFEAPIEIVEEQDAESVDLGLEETDGTGRVGVDPALARRHEVKP